MSHFFQAVGKVFSKVWDFIRPVVEVVAIAAAVYFTAGVALSYFPSTAAFAASMPGFASAGGVAGEGVFSSLASSIGLGGGLASGADAAAVAAGTDAATVAAGGAAATPFAAAPAAAAGADAGTAAIATGTDAAATGAAAATPLAPYVGAGADVLPAAAVPTATAGAGASAASALTNKLLLASVGTQLISGLSSPSPTDIASAKAGFYGSFYGKDSNGSGAPAPDLSVGPQSEPQNTSTLAAAQPTPGVNVPAPQLAAPAPGVPGFQGVQKAQLIPSVPGGVTAVPGAAASNQVAGTTPLAQPQLITTPAKPVST